MGNNSNDVNLFYNLPLSNVDMDFKLFPENFELAINYNDTVLNIGEEKVKQSLIYNSTAAFALIDILEIIDYNFYKTAYIVKRLDIESLYSDFDNILKDSNWSMFVQSKINDMQYIEETVLKVFNLK